MKNCLQDAKNIPKFLCFTATIWHSEDIGWEFNKENVEQYILIEEAYSNIQQLKRTDTFSNLTEKQKQAAVAFSLWYELEDKQMYREVSLKNVNEKLLEWINE